MKNNEQSYVAINTFKKYFKLSNGDVFLAKIDVETLEGKNILADTCECVFSYNVAYEQAEITIIWNYSDAQLKRNSLAKGYNTNYHMFRLEENCLLIAGGKISVLVEFLEKR